jgi:hypothetical protein
MELKREGGESTSYSLNNDGLGKYTIDIGQLPEGLYNFEAVAYRGSREIDRRDGQFSVSENVIEYTNTQRNDPLLRDIASSSGGAYVSWDQAGDLLRMLETLNLHSPSERQVAFDWYPTVELVGSYWHWPSSQANGCLESTWHCPNGACYGSV